MLEVIIMRTFLIQTIDNKIKHDFSFQLLEAINYQKLNLFGLI